VVNVNQVVSLGPNEVQVSLTFEVKFVKSTMFRRIIESSTNTEMMKWLVDFFAYLKKVGTLRDIEFRAFFLLNDLSWFLYYV
jgi:hypothetical protein